MLYSDTPGGNTFTSTQVTRITPAGRILPDSDTSCGIPSPPQRSPGLFQRIGYAIFRYSRGKYLHLHTGNQDYSSRKDTARSDTPFGIPSPAQRSPGLFQRNGYAIFRYSRGKYLHLHIGNQDYFSR